MEHRTRTIFWVLVTLFCVYCMVDFVESSILTTDGHSKSHYKTAELSASIQDRSRLRRRRFLRRQDNLCADILGSKWNMTNKPKGPCPRLDVWVPKKVGFTEFVKVNEQLKVEDGFSIAIFCHAIQLLPFRVLPNFTTFMNNSDESGGTYDQLVENIKDKPCQAVAGDVTIRGNRAQHVDFTIPYLNSEVYMLVPGVHEWNQTLWTFLKPFTWRLWTTIVVACFFIGVALAVLEYRADNPKFKGPFYAQFTMVFWFPIATSFFQEGKILNRCSKVVLVMWLSMIFIVVQIFTATLSSWLTLDQLHPGVPLSFENAGYQDGTFLKDFIKQQYHCSGCNLVPLKSVEEYKSALSNGSVNVVIDELPYIELFLAKYGSSYMKVGPINQESGFAFAFPHHSHLLHNISKAVINVTESDTMMELKKKYLGFFTPNTSELNEPLPKSLDVQSFIGLFVIMGTVTIAAVIWSEILLMRTKNKVLPVLSTNE